MENISIEQARQLRDYQTSLIEFVNSHEFSQLKDGKDRKQAGIMNEIKQLERFLKYKI